MTNLTHHADTFDQASLFNLEIKYHHGDLRNHPDTRRMMMTDAEKVNAVQCALDQEAQTLFNENKFIAMGAIHDFSEKCSGASLVRLFDIITLVSAKN